MSDDSNLRILGNTPKAVSRRRFIQGVIGGGAAVCASSYFLAQNWFFANGNPFGDSVGKRQKARRSSHRALKILILGNFVFSVV